MSAPQIDPALEARRQSVLAQLAQLGDLRPSCSTSDSRNVTTRTADAPSRVPADIAPNGS